MAPYNTYYPQLEEHLNQVGIDPNTNYWNKLVALGIIDPHDSLSHPAGGSDTVAESATCLDPNHFTDFLVGSLSDGICSRIPSGDSAFPILF